jgi:hypothetical protein
VRFWTGQRARERANRPSALHVPPSANTKKEEDKAEQYGERPLFKDDKSKFDAIGFSA